MAPSKKVVLELAGHEVAISNPDKIFFPRTGYTKMDLVEYYLAVAAGAVRGVLARPMAMKRYVNGVEGDFFFQKRAPSKSFLRTDRNPDAPPSRFRFALRREH